jgi:SAM-dependent methyltransferase
MKDLVDNKIELNDEKIWTLVSQEEFDYSDGQMTERYLEKVLNKAADLSSDSFELEKFVRDWPSEYHLSRNRARLLSCFEFDKSKKVLEVGCGCGAITRFLGETFDSVLAIEGSPARARLARLRTKDMQNVSIICAPFQELKFREHFDIIFCIGVYEYANAFVAASNPYDTVLQYFHNALTPDGILVLAIENQFGLKYFASRREDHTGIKFDGLEGYPHFGNKAKTFGYQDLTNQLHKYFAQTKFYFPYPDYKLPSCILSKELFKKVKAGELIGNFSYRDYFYNQKSLFDEKLVLLEIDKNNQLPFFSNSFLVFAGKTKMPSTGFGCLGLTYTTDRVKKFQTITRFVEHENGSIWAEKEPIYGTTEVKDGKLTLRSLKDKWVDGLSIQTQLMRRSKERNISIDELFDPCKKWLGKLKHLSHFKGNEFWLDGKYMDCIWRNSYLQGDQCLFIDLEWEWEDQIRLKTIVIRSIYLFLNNLSSLSGVSPVLKKRSLKRLICAIAKSIGIRIDFKDFNDFFQLHAEIMNIVCGSNKTIKIYTMKAKFWNRQLFTLCHTLFIQITTAARMLPKIVDHILKKIP